MNFAIPIITISAVWFISEIMLGIFKRSNEKNSSSLDKSSLRLLWIVITVSVTVTVTLGISGVGRISGEGYYPILIGLALILLGLILRWTAILTLRRYFTVNVAIAKNQVIIETGLYKYLRHPAYTGSLLSFLGLGLIFASWLTVIAATVPVALAFLYRIKVEEKAMIAAFGNDYIVYSRRTKRLIPGIY